MLHIAKAQLEDAGPYMCQLNTEPMKWKMGVLNVIIKPDIVDVTGARAVSEGGNVRSVGPNDHFLDFEMLKSKKSVNMKM